MNQQKSRQLAVWVCLIGCGLGVLLILAGVGWSKLGVTRIVYSPEQAKEWEEAQAALHAASSDHNHEDSTPPEAPEANPDAVMSAARERFERADAELQSARFVKDRLGPLLTVIGLAAAGAFGVGSLLARGAAV